jgi:hypothetical protein
MTFRSLLMMIFVSLICLNPVLAQYEPDTSLSYETFLRQCMKFSDQRRDEVWVVNFWATWNRSSLDMLPQLKTAQLRYVNKPVRFISISVDKDRRIWESNLDYFQIPWENMFLPNEADYTFLKRAFKHNSLPANYVVNPEGNIRRVQNMDEFYLVMDQQTRELPNQPYSGFSELVDITPPPTNEPPITQPSEPPQPETPSTNTEGHTIQDGWVVHTVAPGETLFSLYRKYNVKVDQIRSRNGLRSNTIKVGQVLKIKPAS